ncbi:MAG: SDR family oxidoreductase [Deltaproteobacteria bacterium]|nr:SDR family oxidoreductase [Deltaproteobacteria bacterium]MBW2361198.1 SDR family oxidoreductase [Deltaproteobacteria bacterium]
MSSGNPKPTEPQATSSDRRLAAVAEKFSGKVALVTGAGSGIGSAIASALAEEGAKVVVSDIAIAGGQETVGKIGDAGGEATFVRADVGDAAEVEALVAKTVETYGRLDCAVNNAGIDGDVSRITECSLENWDRVLTANLTGVFLCMKSEISQMLKQGSGAIVNIASTQGVVGTPGSCPYVASKHGVVGLTKSVALQYATDGIRINAMCPGNTRTPLLDQIEESQPEIYEQLLAGTPVGRLAQPSEIAAAVLWLCSDAASFCTGHAMLVDGGYTAQ